MYNYAIPSPSNKGTTFSNDIIYKLVNPISSLKDGFELMEEDKVTCFCLVRKCSHLGGESWLMFEEYSDAVLHLKYPEEVEVEIEI